MSFISSDKLSAIISLTVAVAIMAASFFQWWDITYNGKMVTKKWVKGFFIVMIVLLSTALVLILF